MVCGIGTTRVMCAVPSGSKVAESFSGAGVDCAFNADGKHKTVATATMPAIFIGRVVPTSQALVTRARSLHERPCDWRQRRSEPVQRSFIAQKAALRNK